jgi:hypothetical protein
MTDGNGGLRRPSRGMATLRDRLADGTDLVTASLDRLRKTMSATLADTEHSGRLLPRDVEAKVMCPVVTEDGTSSSDLVGVIEASHLALSTGCNPALLAREARARERLPKS